MRFEFIFKVKFRLDLCKEDAQSLTVEAAADKAVYKWDGTAPICDGNCNNFKSGSILPWENTDIPCGKDGWTWTGDVSKDGDEATCVSGRKVYCAKVCPVEFPVDDKLTMKPLTIKKTLTYNGAAVKIMDCNDMLGGLCKHLKGQAAQSHPAIAANPLAAKLVDIAIPDGFHVSLEAKFEKVDTLVTMKIFMHMCATNSADGALMENLCPTDLLGGPLEIFRTQLEVTSCNNSAGDDPWKGKQHCKWDRMVIEDEISVASPPCTLNVVLIAFCIVFFLAV
eukprot:TRINITY_DN90896_c0_g1_i1.p1 TRINITY_DN90896_c0_g1~~TRINITY_DN90896_c0_g1_i1.p1  ORF type:complete len:280 (+),score=49.65 TRINITY_DN90896_c0_g1_i1:555-1394(+)